MMKLSLALLTLVFTQNVFADGLWCNYSFQGTPTEAIRKHKVVTLYRDIKIDVMDGAQIQIDLQDNYREFRKVQTVTWYPKSQSEWQTIGGVALGDYFSPNLETLVARIELTEQGKILLTFVADNSEHFCEVPGDYRPSYSKHVKAHIKK